jgi:hypothetical protein
LSFWGRVEYGVIDPSPIIETYPLPDHHGKYAKWTTKELTLSDYIDAGKQWREKDSIAGALRTIERKLTGEEGEVVE